MLGRAKYITTCLAVSCAWPAMAQTAAPSQPAPSDQSQPAPSEPSAGQGDIIVTALKRADRAQDVPISLGVISGDRLATKGITNVTQLGAELPNVSITSPYGDTQPSFVVRGITMSDYAMNQQSPNAIYVDEVYKGVAALQAMQLFDLQRVEVLRGPQGTLYGKNATGGAVSFYTRTPTFDGTHGYLSLGYGNYNDKQIEGAIGVQLSGTVAIRVAGIYEKADGWVHEIQPNVPDTGSKDNYAFRAGLRFQPTSGTDIILRGSISRTRSSGIADISTNGPEGVFDTGTPPFDRAKLGLGYYENDKGEPSSLRSDTKNVSLTVKQTLSKNLTLTSISSYDYGSLYNREDADNTPFQLANIIDASTVKAYAQDLRLGYDSGSLKFLAGAYYNREKVHYGEQGEFLFKDGTYDPANPAASSCAQDGFTGCRYVDDLIQIKTSSAVYANASYRITPQFEVLGGIRYTHDVARLPHYRSYYDFHDAVTGAELHEAVVTITESPIKRVVDNNVSFKIGANYKPSRDVLIYVSYSTGYRGSAFNGLAFNSPDQITAAKPEKVYAAEIGEKIQLFDRKLTINSSLFHYIYTNQQSLGSLGQSTIQTLFNAPKAKIWGGEFDITAQPTRALRLNISGGYTDGKYGEGIIAGNEVGGNRLIGAPKWTLNGGATVVAVDDDRHELTFNAQANYSSRRYFDIFQQFATSQPAFWLVDGNISLTLKRQKIELSAWGRNLLGQHYIVGAQDLRGFTNQVFKQLGQPRTFGVKAKLTF